MTYRILALLLIVFAVSSCGIKGELYLEDEKVEERE